MPADEVLVLGDEPADLVDDCPLGISLPHCRQRFDSVAVRVVVFEQRLDPGLDHGAFGENCFDADDVITRRADSNGV